MKQTINQKLYHVLTSVECYASLHIYQSKLLLDIIFQCIFNTFNAFYKSSFDEEYVPSPVPLNKDVGLGGSSYEINHLLWFYPLILSTAPLKILFKYYIPPQRFFFASVEVLRHNFPSQFWLETCM